jgi:hypothetical protein
MWTNVVFFNALQLGVSWYACKRGGKPERWVAIAMIAAAIATLIAYSPYPRTFFEVEYGVFVIDLLLLGSLVGIAVNANRYWPMGMASLHLASTIAHLGKLLDLSMSNWAYALLLKFWAYPMLLTLVIGTMRHRRRLAHYGVDRSWSTFNA